MKELEQELTKFRKIRSIPSEKKRDELLKRLRNDEYKNDWFRSTIVRDFLNEFVADSRFVPKAVSEAIEASKQELTSTGVAQTARQRFLDYRRGRTNKGSPGICNICQRTYGIREK